MARMGSKLLSSGSGGGAQLPDAEQAGHSGPTPGVVEATVSLGSLPGESSEERPDRPFTSDKGMKAEEKVIRLRRAMQRERKELLAELRPSPIVERPGTATSRCSIGSEPRSAPFTRRPFGGGQIFEMSSLALQGAKETSEEAQGVGNDEAAESPTRQPRRIPRGSTESVLAKVNRAHKGLVRKEVWRQKFDFLYKQVEEEMKSEIKNPSHSSSAGAEPNLAASRANPASGIAAREHMRPDTTAVTGTPRHSSRSMSRHSSRPSSASHRGSHRTRSCSNTGMSTGTATTTHLTNHITELSVELSSFDGESCAASKQQRSTGDAWGVPPSTAARGGWCVTRKGRHNLRRRQAPSGCARIHSNRPAVCSSSALPPLLSGSSSLPLLAAERRAGELCGIRDDYYGGDDLFMHEDILHCSNPSLFPLRPSHSHAKAFPLRSLEAYHGYYSEASGDASVGSFG